ncbi:MAG TPA: glycosyltransferase family 4 protein [Anaerolineaceae bacterium]
MRVCMVVSNLLDFGGLEEFAKNLAVGVQRQGVEVSVLSTTWVPPQNQYLRGLRDANITYVQLPRWISLINTDWTTKEKILKVLMVLCSPVTLVLALGLLVTGRRNLGGAFSSAYHWLQGKLMAKVVAPDRSKPFARRLLGSWKSRWKYDLIHIHGYTSGLLYVIDWAYDHQVPVVYQEHQTPDAQFDWWKDFKNSINKASTVVAVSEISAKALREVASVNAPMVVAYYMVPDPMETGWCAEPAANRPGEALHITTPARLYVTKGLNYLLDAIELVQSEHPNAEFKVYGGGPLRDELLEYARNLGLNGAEIFPGPYTSREQLAEIMKKTDIFVLSSILEGLPIALLEAMSYGRAVVVTPVGGIPEAIFDGENGLLCEPRDAQCLSKKIGYLIEHPEERERLGKAARKSYENGPFHPTAVSKQFVSIYQGILEKGNIR